MDEIPILPIPSTDDDLNVAGERKDWKLIERGVRSAAGLRAAFTAAVRLGRVRAHGGRLTKGEGAGVMRLRNHRNSLYTSTGLDRIQLLVSVVPGLFC